jgi:hypothetical protein
LDNYEKESLNSGGQQFHQCRLIKRNYHLFSPQIIEYEKDHNHKTLEIHVLVWDRHTFVVELNRLWDSNRPSLLITDINKQ